MDLRSQSHPPLIPSQLSAKLSVEQWDLARNAPIVDKDGLVWQLEVEKKQKSDPTSYKHLHWQIILKLKAEADCATLLGCSTLHPQEDARLLSLIADKKIPFALKPIVVQAIDEETAIKEARAKLRAFLEDFDKKSLNPIKRTVIGKFIDAHLQFKQQHP